MCNAWNHSPGCNCGWGGVNYGNDDHSRVGSLLSSQIQDLVTCSSSDKDDPKTFLTLCPWCNDSVYYHTNGYGDSVYFDSLSYPWQVHECFKNYWESKKANNKKESGQTKNQSLYRDFFTISEDQQKRLILIGAIHQVPHVIFGEILIYRATEKALAKQIEITVQDLREIYGHLYVQELGGIKIFSLEEIEQKQKKQSLILGSLNSEHLTITKSTPKTNIFNKYLTLNSTKTVNPNQLINCPKCHQRIKKNRLDKHISKKCHAVHLNRLIAVPDSKQSVIDKDFIKNNSKKSKKTHSKSPIILCPICHQNVRSDNLKDHIIISCPKYQKMRKKGVC